MKSNRKMMLSAALIVAVVALAGAGYAVVGYTATTTIEGNAIKDSEYLKIAADGTAYSGLSGEYGFNTVTTYDSGYKLTFGEAIGGTYTQYVHGTTVNTTADGADHKCIVVKTITLTVDFSNAASAASASVTMTATPGTSGSISLSNDSIIKLYVVKDGTVQTLTTNALTFSVTKPTGDVKTVEVPITFLIGAPTAAQTYTVGTAMVNDSLVNVNLEFVATSASA